METEDTKILGTATSQLGDALQPQINDADFEKLTKQCRDLADEIADGVVYSIKDNLAHWLADHVNQNASRVIEAIIAGNEREARRYLSLKPQSYYDGRDFQPWFSSTSKMHESGPVEIRRKIVEAHRDLITDARIADLEAQLDLLVKKYYVMEHSDMPRMRDALRAAEDKLEQWRQADESDK